MRLVASAIVRNELGRYLEPWINHLLVFCDLAVVLDDNSVDGTAEYLSERERVLLYSNTWPPMFEHEGRARQHLLDLTMDNRPTHILAIDADEFIGDGPQLREQIEADWVRQTRRTQPRAWRLQMQEVWRATPDRLFIRRDGGWRPHNPPILYHPPSRLSGPWRIQDKALSSGREPRVVNQYSVRREKPLSDILHFGWTNESERAERFRRYTQAPGGHFHQDRHVQSIMWDDRRVHLSQREWPSGLSAWQSILLDCATRDRHLLASRA